MLTWQFYREHRRHLLTRAYEETQAFGRPTGDAFRYCLAWLRADRPPSTQIGPRE